MISAAAETIFNWSEEKKMRNAVRLALVPFLLLFAGVSLSFADNGFLDLTSPVFLGGGGGTATPGEAKPPIIGPSDPNTFNSPSSTSNRTRTP